MGVFFVETVLPIRRDIQTMPTVQATHLMDSMTPEVSLLFLNVFFFCIVLWTFIWYHHMCTGDRNIKALKLRCSNNEKGCLWTGELRSIDEHHSTCGYSSIQCPNHCTDGKKEVYLLRKNLKNHVSRKCFKRQYNCPHCNETGEYQEITTGHLQVCPQVEVSCGNVGCKETVPRCQLEAHHFNCPFELLDCVYHGRGCQRKLLPEKL